MAMRTKIAYSFAPSIRALSMKSFGREKKNWRIMKTPNAVRLSGMINPQYVFCSPSLRTRINSGTTIASNEIMIVASTIMKRRPFPLNLYFANP